jgi:hypothetical protein
MTDPVVPPPAKKSFFRALLDFFSPDYVFPQPKGRRIQGGPEQVNFYLEAMDREAEARKAEKRKGI